MKRLYLLLFLGIYFFNVSPVMADLDCGDDVISVDPHFAKVWTKEEVKKLCGNPANINNWSEETVSHSLDGDSIRTVINYSMWTYDQGSRTFIEYLLFKNGMLIDMKDGNYGEE